MYTQTDGTEVSIPLRIIVYPKMKVFVPDCVDYFPLNLCEKYQHSSLFVKVLIQISELLYDEILDKIPKQDKLNFTGKLEMVILCG